MKFCFIILSVFFVNCSFGQSLRLNDIEKCLNYSSPNDFTYLNKKGFLMAIDSIDNEFALRTFENEATNEWLKLFFNKDSTGAEWVKVDYRMQSETAYKKIY